MELRFIGQGYNTAIGTSVAETLIASFNNEIYHSFVCLVAFASYSGVTGLTNHVNNSRNHLRKFRVIIGIDQNGTSKEALEALLEWEVDSYIFNTSSDFIFHPKIYIFEGDDNIKIIIGSNNLTQTGLSQNIESSIEVSFTKEDEQGMRFFEEIKTYYNPIIDGPHVNLKQLTDELIEGLFIEGKIPTESQRRSLYNKSENAPYIQANEAAITFPTLQIQQLPPGFSPRRLNRPPNLAPVLLEEQTPLDLTHNLNWDFSNENEVLIAEIGTPTRWKQISFTKKNFQLFFNLPIDVGSSGQINLKYIDTDGNLQDDVEQCNSARVKKSKNYNLEPLATRECNTPYNFDNKPIIFFVKINTTHFIYHLETNGSQIYNELNTLLGAKTGNSLRRKVTTVSDIRTNCPSISI
ncbi:restriction endonuclease PLD domain-containing protein [Chryseobacterium candidae]|uniref:NgoFVII family restriction endonuclease n=1 Tax=Chryseobacterium candidae TaxID=1978493 RepID=A0ABY2R2C0_9FLAO|nr:restriction endonuclease PLD domain-containing protein [Chryseobacterium candidae]THV56359.1 NgoFVII family restriction endonuclease [Chryseobacterium candidae]